MAASRGQGKPTVDPGWASKVHTSTRDGHDSIWIIDLQPVHEGIDQNPDIAHLLEGPASVPQLPSTPIEPCEGVVSDILSQKDHDLTINECPEGVHGADWHDPNRHAHGSRDSVVLHDTYCRVQGEQRTNGYWRDSQKHEPTHDTFSAW